MCECSCCDVAEVGDGAGIFRIVLGVLAVAIVLFFLWGIYEGVVAATSMINAFFDWFADQFIDLSPLVALVTVVYWISMWAKRHAPVPPLAIRGPRALLPKPVGSRPNLLGRGAVLPVQGAKLKEKANARN